jgi:tape measure domain-containing protein
MASGVQLATAYISLNVRTDDIKKQVAAAFKDGYRQAGAAGAAAGTSFSQGMRNSLSGGSAGGVGLFAPIQIAGLRWAAGAGKAIGSALKTAILAGLTAGVAAAVLGAGTVLTAGLNRLKILQRAEVQLSLKLSPAEIKQVKTDITKVVEGTPISLDQALQAVPRAISAGLRGKELTQYIKDVADVTAATGGQASFEQLDIILGQIRSKGKLTGEELAQLIDAGVDVRGILKETLSLDDKGLDAALKKGKIGIDQIQKSVQKLYGQQGGGLAKMYGETFDGAVSNLKASTARLGANILGVIFGDPNNPDGDPLQGAVNGVQALTDKLNTAGKWVAANKDEIRGYFIGAKDTAGQLYDGVKNIVDWFKKLGAAAGDIGTKVGNAFDTASGAVGRLYNKITEVVGKVKSGVEEIVQKIKDYVTNAFNSVFGPDSTLGKLMAQLGIGMPTAGASSAPFNAGPSSGSPTGKLVPSFDLNDPTTVGGLLGSGQSGAMPSGGLSARVPAQSAVGAQIYNGPVTEDTGGAVEPRNAMVQDLIQQQFGDAGAWIGNDYRKPDGYNEHSSGQAADIMVNELGKRSDESIALGNKVNKWLIDNAAKIGLQYTIWNGTLYRPGGKTSPNPGQGITGNHEDHVHYRVKPGKVDELPQFSRGGSVWGAGSATSDSIPAMLSNGEHVLTAAEVKQMGGQGGVYAFRQALQNGLIPGFAPGGAVDASDLLDMQNQASDLQASANVALAQLNEARESGAEPGELLRAQINFDSQLRKAMQAKADLATITAGGTPADRSLQNAVFDQTDALKLAQQQFNDLPEDASASQRMSVENQLGQTRRDRDQAIAALQGQAGGTTDYGGDFIRSMGFIPANAGNTGVAGTSSLSSVIGMGNDIVGGLIDTGASLAQTAASAAMAGASFGGSALAGPAAGMATSYGIQLAASTAKRLSSYGFQMASIGADSLIEQLFPFGAPRWLGYDYTGFAPQLGVMGAATTTLEKMGGDAIKKYFNPGSNPMIPSAALPGVPSESSGPAAPQAPQPVDPNAQQLLQYGDPGFMTSPAPWDPNWRPPVDGTMAGGGGGGGSWARGGAVGVYDNGGILKPGQLAFNASRTPESILTRQQWNAMAASSSNPPKGGAPLVENLYAQDMQDAIRQLEKHKRRDMMQYAGRP